MPRSELLQQYLWYSLISRYLWLKAEHRAHEQTWPLNALDRGHIYYILLLLLLFRTYICYSIAHNSHCLFTHFCIWGAYSDLVTQHLSHWSRVLFHKYHSQSTCFSLQNLRLFFLFFWFCSSILIQLNHGLSVGTEFTSIYNYLYMAFS